MAGAFDPLAFQNDSFQVEAGTSVTAADSVSSVSDAVTRVATYVRSVSDSVSSISESVSAGQAIARAVADAVATLTEAPTRIWTAGRSVADTISTLTESPARIVTMARTASATIASISEAVVRSFSLSRTVADSVVTLTEAVVRAKMLNRTASDTISSITQSVSRAAMSVSRAAVDAVSFLTDRITSFSTPYVSGTAIYLGGVNIAKPDGDPVLFASARFVSAVNGVPGTCSFRARDDTGTANYVPGQPLELIIDGLRVWTGFVSSVKRVYVFPALNVDDFGPTRFFDIEGVDLNILFTRRIVFNQANPANVLAPLYGNFTSDATAISALNDGWLDLSGDNIDTSTLVEHVAAINEDQAARGWEGSDQWGQAMSSIASLPAAIFYLDPYRREVYTDTDTPNAPFGLSDAPNGTTTRGYREMEVLYDGTSLANDVMCWGVGYGSNLPVFDRDEDATSIGDHGRWQLGQTTFGVYKQATIERIADSIINGSPEHHRGAKDDRTAVTITTYEPGLLPAQKVNFESTVFGYSDILPIRKMEVTFPAPDKPKYELTLSHEIDTPNAPIDPFWLGDFTLPGFHLPPFPILIGPDIPGGCDCGITDTFDRTIASGSGWGTSTSGLPWTYTPSGSSTAGVDGTQGYISANGLVRLTGWIPGLTAETRFQFRLSQVSASNQDWLDFTIGSADLRIDYGTGRHALPGSGTELRLIESGAGVAAVKFGYTAGVLYNCHLLYTPGTDLKANVWPDGSTEPGTWDITLTSTLTSVGTLIPSFSPSSDYVTPPYVYIDNLDITDVNRCTENRFDNFDRTVSGGWGTSTTGYVWTTGGVLNGAVPSVTSGFGRTSVPSGNAGSVNDQSVSGAGVWGSAFTLTALFRSSTMTDNWRDTRFTIEGASGGQIVEAWLDHASGGIFVHDGTSGSTDFQNYTGWAANTWMYVKWEHTPGVSSKLKVWNAGSAEPDWIATIAGGTAFTPVLFRTVTRGRAGTSTATLTADFYYIDFDYDGKPCYTGGPPPTPPSVGGPFFGPLCEVAVRIDSTHYQLSRAVASGTTSVYVGTPGYLYLPGIARDYVCSYATGILTFSDVVAESDPVYVCYTAAGPIAP